MDALPVGEIRELEQKAKAIGLDERSLIENASSNLFGAINGLGLGREVAVISGRGNNGADVLCCGRKLASRGYKVEIVVLEEKALGCQVQAQKDILQNLGLKVHSLTENDIDSLTDIIREKDFVLEGILGIGIKGQVSPFLNKVITIVNENAKKIISCDIPSGLSPDSGQVLGEAIKADCTITFISAKKGFFMNQGPMLCGKIFVVDIGVSKELLQNLRTNET